METYIVLKELITPTGKLGKSYLRVVDGVIKEVSLGRPKPPTSSILNYSDFIGVPGFVDTHIHGIGGADVNSGKVGDLIRMSKELIRYGVTSFLPTTVTAPHEDTLRVCKAVYEVITEWGECLRLGDVLGARVLGLHLEGPYINPEKRGAQNPEYIREPSINEFLEYLRACRGYLKVITLAPEVRGCLELIEVATKHDVVVSLGHSNADYEVTKEAIKRGLRRATHLFNAMRRVHHRDPGAVIALLEDPRVFIELIPDFIHLHPAIVKFVINYVGTWRAVVITDAISATALPDGTYSLGGLEVIVKDGVARLRNGALAGSTLTLDRALKNLLSLKYDLIDVTRLLSYNPAVSIGEYLIGDLSPGKYADLTILDDEFNVVATVIAGHEVFRT